MIEPLLPNKLRCVPRVDGLRVLNGIYRVLRSGVPWRDVPQRYGPDTTCCNRFLRRVKAEIWDSWMAVITSASNDGIAMIDGTSVRAHHPETTLRADHQIAPCENSRRLHNQNPRLNR